VIGSAVDAAVAMRPRPADFARWAKRGIEGWSWDEARAPLVSSTVVGMADAIATGRTSDVAAARSQAEAALGAYSTDEGEQSEKRNGTDGQWTGGQAFLARARCALITLSG
jgi:choline dehydrogenase-like flavoprotein